MSSKPIPKHILTLAQKLCLKSEMNHKMSAVIYDSRGRVINVGYNRRIIKSRNPTQIFKYGIPYVSIHAEIDALAGLNFGDTIGNYIYIHRSKGLMAKPCEKCNHVLEQFGFKEIKWSE